MIINMLLLLFFVFAISLYLCDSASPQRLPLSCAQIKEFVDGHNIRRQRVARGAVPQQPTAANMIYMVWDEELAEKAARWAENGIFGHNPVKTVGSQRWGQIGENVFIKTLPRPFYVPVIPNILEALDSWFDEHANYGFEPYSLATPRPIGHYTQMVWAESTHVGCGISQKKENGWTTTLIVCNYAPTGNFLGQVPYYSNGAAGYLRCVNRTCRRPYGYYC